MPLAIVVTPPHESERIPSDPIYQMTVQGYEMDLLSWRPGMAELPGSSFLFVT